MPMMTSCLTKVRISSTVATSLQSDERLPIGLAGVTQFCTSVLSSFYFEIIKDSLYADSVSSPRRTAVVYTLQQVRANRLACRGVD